MIRSCLLLLFLFFLGFSLQAQKYINFEWSYTYTSGQSCIYPGKVKLNHFVTDKDGKSYGSGETIIYQEGYSNGNKTLRVYVPQGGSITNISMLVGYKNGKCPGLMSDDMLCYKDEHTNVLFDLNDPCVITETTPINPICGLKDFKLKVNITPEAGAPFSEQGTKQAFCEGENINFVIPCNMQGLSSYQWSISTNGFSFTNVKTNTSGTFIVGKGGDYYPAYGAVTYLRVTSGIYSSSASNSFVFYPAAPILTSTLSSSPTKCFGSYDGEIIIPALTNQSQAYVYTVAKVIDVTNEAPDYTCDPKNLFSSRTPPIVFNGRRYCTGNNGKNKEANGSEVKFFGNDSISAGFWMITIEGKFSGKSGGQCAYQEVIEVKEPTELVFSSAVKSSYSSNGNTYNLKCHDGKDKITLNVSGGTKPYYYKLDNGSFVQFSNPTSGSQEISGLNGNIDYTIYVKDANDCPSGSTKLSRSVKLIPPPKLTADILPKDIRCKGNKDGEIQIVSVSGGLGATPYLYSLSTEKDKFNYQSSSNIYTGLSPDVPYYISVKDNNECVYIHPDPIILSEPEVLEFINPVKTPPTCLWGDDGQLTISGKGGISSDGKYTFSLYDQNTNAFILAIDESVAVFENLKANKLFKVIMTDDNGCTMQLSNIIIPDPSNPLEAIKIPEIHPSCYGESDGVIRVTAKNGKAANNGIYSFELEGIFQEADTAIFSGLTEGKYVVKVYDSNVPTCIDTVYYELVDPELIKIKNRILTPVTCKSGTDGRAEIEIKGGVGPYIVEWYSGLGALSNNLLKSDTISSITSIQNLQEGDYLLRITDINGCPKTENGWIEDKINIRGPVHRLSISESKTIVSNISCSDNTNGYVELFAEGGWSDYKYSMDNINYSDINYFNNLNSGVYTFYVKDNRGCKVSREIEIIRPQTITIKEEIKNVSCKGGRDGEINLIVTGGTGSYELSTDDGKTWTAGTFLNNLAAKVYILKIRDQEGCSISYSTEVSEPEKLEIIDVNSVSASCGNSNGRASFTVTGGSGDYAIKWKKSNGEVMEGYTSIIVENLPSGLYIIEVIDGNGCSETKEISISDSDGPQVDVLKIVGVSCSGKSDGSVEQGDITGVGPFQVSWIKGNDIKTEPKNLSAGAWNLEITDQKGCKLIKEINIPSPTPLAINNITATKPACNGNCNGSISIQVEGGTKPYKYFWDNGGNAEAISGICAGTYKVEIIDSNGCNITETITLEETEPIVVDLGTGATLCEGQILKLDAGNTGTTYSWTSDNGYTSSAQVVEIGKAGKYTVTVTDGKGCSGVGSFELKTSRTLLQADFLMSDKALTSDTIVLVNVTYPLAENNQWNFSSSAVKISSQQFAEELIFTEPGTYDITLYTTLGNCVDQVTKSITVYKDQAGLESGRLGYSPVGIQNLTLFPNPTSGTFQVNVDLAKASELTVQVINIFQNKVLAFKEGKEKKYYEFDFSLKDILPGVYLLVVKTGDEVSTKRFIVN